MLLTPLDETQAKELRETLARRFLESPSSFSCEALKRLAWIAVPAENNLSEKHAAAIAAAAAAGGVRVAFAVSTEPEILVEAVEVELTEEGLLAFDANCMLRVFLLVAEGESFAILDEGDYYYIIAGPPSFVEQVVGGSIMEAQEEFLRYASRPQWPQKTKDFLLEVLLRYSGAPGVP